MEEDPEMRRKADAILASIERKYGFIPVVNQVTSTRPDIFVPAVGFSKAVLDRADGELDRKTRFLCAVAASSATGSEYCVDVQIKHAIEAGANRDEVLEAIMIGSYMSLTRSQSYALRKYAENFEIELK